MRLLIWILVVVMHCLAFGSLFVMQGCGTRKGDVHPPPPPPMPPRVYAPPTQPERLPLPPSPVVSRPLDDVKMYTVRKGDSISVIAHRFDVTVEEIVELNSIKNKDVVMVGQKLKLPARVDLSAPVKRSPVPSAPPSAPPIASGSTYVVQSGDSLSKIASRFGVTVANLREHNRLSGDLIKVGQKLKIPGSEQVSAPTPAPKTPAPLPEREEIKPETVEAKAPPVEDDPVVGDSGITHVVLAGETLADIARLYAVTVEELATLNKISPDAQVSPGTRLRIPL